MCICIYVYIHIYVVYTHICCYIYISNVQTCNMYKYNILVHICILLNSIRKVISFIFKTSVMYLYKRKYNIIKIIFTSNVILHYN